MLKPIAHHTRLARQRVGDAVVFAIPTLPRSTRPKLAPVIHVPWPIAFVLSPLRTLWRYTHSDHRPGTALDVAEHSRMVLVFRPGTVSVHRHRRGRPGRLVEMFDVETITIEEDPIVGRWALTINGVAWPVTVPDLRELRAEVASFLAESNPNKDAA